MTDCCVLTPSNSSRLISCNILEHTSQQQTDSSPPSTSKCPIYSFLLLCLRQFSLPGTPCSLYFTETYPSLPSSFQAFLLPVDFSDYHCSHWCITFLHGSFVFLSKLYAFWEDHSVDILALWILMVLSPNLARFKCSLLNAYKAWWPKANHSFLHLTNRYEHPLCVLCWALGSSNKLHSEETSYLVHKYTEYWLVEWIWGNQVRL